MAAFKQDISKDELKVFNSELFNFRYTFNYCSYQIKQKNIRKKDNVKYGKHFEIYSCYGRNKCELNKTDDNHSFQCSFIRESVCECFDFCLEPELFISLLGKYCL